jgi:N utilization substance protein B
LVDLAILRLIVWEAHHKNTPKKVLIDEAVELAKEFGSDSSPRFVNGVLGQLLMQENNKK